MIFPAVCLMVLEGGPPRDAPHFQTETDVVVDGQ